MHIVYKDRTLIINHVSIVHELKNMFTWCQVWGPNS